MWVSESVCVFYSLLSVSVYGCLCLCVCLCVCVDVGGMFVCEFFKLLKIRSLFDTISLIVMML